MLLKFNYGLEENLPAAPAGNEGSLYVTSDSHKLLTSIGGEGQFVNLSGGSQEWELLWERVDVNSDITSTTTVSLDTSIDCFNDYFRLDYSDDNNPLWYSRFLCPVPEPYNYSTVFDSNGCILFFYDYEEQKYYTRRINIYGDTHNNYSRKIKIEKTKTYSMADGSLITQNMSDESILLPYRIYKLKR